MNQQGCLATYCVVQDRPLVCSWFQGLRLLGLGAGALGVQFFLKGFGVSGPEFRVWDCRVLIFLRFRMLLLLLQLTDKVHDAGCAWLRI